MKSLIKSVSILFIAFFIFSCQQKPATPAHNPLGNATRTDKNGWIYVHLSGSPADIGYQHGYLLSKEIDTLIKVMQLYLPHTTGKSWNFYRAASARFIWKKIDPEYQQEIKGIASGLQAHGLKYDTLDVAALNAYMELSDYYVPALANKIKPGSDNNQAPGKCSGFIATGKYTKDGKIVMGHNNWSEYIDGERWNVIADIIPLKGNHILMDCPPGFIHSGDDFVVNSGGIIITETTITGFNGFDTTRTPEFVRARKAAQYANSIDDVIKIMSDDNNGGYANDWLIGDTKTNEVAKIELGLKNVRVWRSRDTAMAGSNFPIDPKLIKEETTYNAGDKTASSVRRKARIEQLLDVTYKGKLDADGGKSIEADTYDALNNKNIANACVVDGHIDKDPKGVPEWDEAPFYPDGAVQGKVITSDMAKHMEFWAHMGHPSGDDFLAAPFFAAHPQYNWMSPYLRDMKAYPWTLFKAQ